LEAPVAKYVINKDYSGSEETIVADSFHTNGDFVDFVDEKGTVFRILAKNVFTVERQD
jgi:hypothetical protein